MRVLFVGGHGHFYLQRAVAAKLAQPVGWAGDGLDLPAAQQRAAKAFSPALPFFDDYRRAIDQLKPDVLNIGSIYAHNGPIALEALGRGLKVVCDKPIAATWEMLAAIEAKCAPNSGAVLLTEFDLRSRRAFVAAQQAVAEGRIGQSVLATAQKSYRWGTRAEFYKRREDYGGTLLWIASHGIDAVWFVTGCDLLAVSGHQANVSRPEYGSAEDHVALCYRIAGGGSALVHADFLRPAGAPTHGDDRIRVAGSRGLVEVRDDRAVLMSGEAPPVDITEDCPKCDVGVHLVEALNGEVSRYSTVASLQMARWLLQSRDAADRQAWISLGDHRGATGDCRYNG